MNHLYLHLQSEDISLPHACDVVFCDRMMTDAAVKVSKSEVCGNADTVLSSQPYSCSPTDHLSLADSAHGLGNDLDVLSDNSDKQLSSCINGSTHLYTYPSPPPLQNFSSRTTTNMYSSCVDEQLPAQHTLKRQRQDSTDGWY